MIRHLLPLLDFERLERERRCFPCLLWSELMVEELMWYRRYHSEHHLQSPTRCYKKVRSESIKNRRMNIS